MLSNWDLNQGPLDHLPGMVAFRQAIVHLFIYTSFDFGPAALTKQCGELDSLNVQMTFNLTPK